MSKAKAAAKRPAKKQPTEMQAPTAPKPAGVIAIIKEFLESKTGASHNEILDALVQKFPDRTRDGMASTVRIQCSRLAKNTGRAIISKDVADRGRVYKFEDKGAIPGKEAVKEQAAKETAE